MSNQNADGLVDTKQIKDDVLMRARGRRTSQDVRVTYIISPRSNENVAGQLGITDSVPENEFLPANPITMHGTNRAPDAAPASASEQDAVTSGSSNTQNNENSCDDEEHEGNVDVVKFESFMKSMGERSGMPMDEVLEILQESSSGRRQSFQ